MPEKEKVVERLKQVMDPETGTDVYSMGLVSDIEAESDSVSLTFTPTSPFCPMGVQLAVNIKKSLASMEGLEEDDIDITVEGHLNSEEINEKLASGEL
ncbi:MAG: iron-sulfur cluster assembly protein [Candidatus Thermoplasmatota archaeon]|nr:iron-sulfur cluster assembly protein [Candidatus Thermoplasmatota archaeon]MBS3790158.1 iron-sulfur cluster assembly protein [Candidatus Thermoplasmatota archaeon]